MMALGEKPIDHGKKWTEVLDQELTVFWNDAASQKTISEIAKELNRSESSISARLVKIGLASDREEARNVIRLRMKK